MTLSAVLACAADGKAVRLFDGKSLKGWTQCNGTAKYRVEQGAIVGTTNEGSPNSFLCTDKEYGDFILEWESKNDPALNSGVQIRGHRYDGETVVRTFTGKEVRENKQPAGRVYGYQVEIATAKSGASGGVYDEARRGWLENSSNKPECRDAFKDNEWNKYKVEAIGDRIRTWVNGAACADVVDSADLTGFIALQVHSYKGEKPAEVRWRNVRLTDLGKHAWRSLWDGKTLAGWTNVGGGRWTIENGAIKGESVADDPRIGMLLSEESFKDVTTRVRFKIPKGNSGFFVRTDPETRAAYEVEIDSAKRTGGFWEVRGRNWVTGPEDNANVRPDEWNEVTAHLHGHRIVFHLNGVKTVDLPDDKQGRLEGRLGLQAHGAKNPTEVWFKDVAVLEKAK